MPESAQDLLRFPEQTAASAGGSRVVRRRGVRRMRHQTRILLASLAVGVPGVLATVALVFAGDYSGKAQLTILLVVIAAWLVLVAVLYRRVVRPLQTAANMLSAMREGDFSMQPGFIDQEDALGHLMHEIHGISSVMRRERLGAIEAIGLLDRIIAEIDVGLLTFSHEDRRLKLVNKAGERLLGRSAGEMIGRTADDLGLGALLDADPARPLETSFAATTARLGVRRATFREGGRPHVLVLLADIGRALREEERLAWRRLIRVIGHELNNSLAPIHSLSSTLAGILARDPPPPDWREDVLDGLEVIRARSSHLRRFMEDYARIARLPAPHKEPLDVAGLVARIATLEQRLSVEIVAGESCTVSADVSQLEQVLINLLKNAVDAALETDGRVRVGWIAAPSVVEIWIDDEGPGIANPDNLFTPFYSTKRGGSGIGLALSRQIADAHGGQLAVANRTDRTGVRASLVLPR
jgi:nitrogen fixation/metabolism regulation signal transduction histidine kinase